MSARECRSFAKSKGKTKYQLGCDFARSKDDPTLVPSGNDNWAEADETG
jgi:hypothetical protein